MSTRSAPKAGLPDFSAGPADLARRRADRFAPVLAPAVEGFTALADAIVARIPQVNSGRRTVIHGDLVPSNLLVFEAAVAGAIFDM